MRQVCEIEERDFEKLIPRAESIDINKLCGHKVVDDKEEVRAIGRKMLHEEEREQIAPKSNVNEDSIEEAKRRYLERKKLRK